MIDQNELIQYIVVNSDLSMSPGKIAAQVGHVCTICAFKWIDDNTFRKWYFNDQKKVVLQAHEGDIKKLIQHGFDMFILDNGLTEIPSGSLTALSLGVMAREDAKPYVKRLQLLK